MSSKTAFKVVLGFSFIVLVAFFYNTSYLPLFQRFGEDAPKSINGKANVNVSAFEYDDPKLLEIIKGKYLTLPPISLEERNLTKPVVVGPVTAFVLELLGNQTQGFFIEAGANNGEFLSNSLPLEVFYGWIGLLVEGDPVPREGLLKIKRNAWVASSCLSPSKKSDQVNMVRHKSWNGIGNIPKFFPGKVKNDFSEPFEVQCFPLYSLLLAIGKFQIDYLSLDMEGSEYAVLETIPFDKVTIKVISVETNPTAYPKTYLKITELLKKHGFSMRKFITDPYVHDAVFENTLI